MASRGLRRADEAASSTPSARFPRPVLVPLVLSVNSDVPAARFASDAPSRACVESGALGPEQSRVSA